MIINIIYELTEFIINLYINNNIHNMYHIIKHLNYIELNINTYNDVGLLLYYLIAIF